VERLLAADFWWPAAAGVLQNVLNFSGFYQQTIL